MSEPDRLDPEADPFRPPDVPIEVECIHCGREYDSYLIEWREEPDADGQLHGFWCCPTPGCDGRGFGFAGSAEWRADFLALPGRADHFVIDLLEWLDPKPVGRPYAEANHLGLYRVAFLVEDAHAGRDALLAEGVECGPPVWLDMGDEIPIDGLWAVFFRDPDGACLELIQRPEIRE